MIRTSISQNIKTYLWCANTEMTAEQFSTLCLFWAMYHCARLAFIFKQHTSILENIFDSRRRDSIHEYLKTSMILTLLLQYFELNDILNICPIRLIWVHIYGNYIFGVCDPNVIDTIKKRCRWIVQKNLNLHCIFELMSEFCYI